MADNTTLNPGTGGDVVASNDVAGVKYPRTKIQTGAAGVAGGDVTATNPFDVRIGDATNTASVKAASTAAAAADKALVVAVHPTSSLPTGANTLGAVTAPGAAALALDATLTGGTAKSVLRTAAKGTTVAADATSTPVDANTQALHTSVTNFPATQPVSIAAAVDTSDRAARLVGVVYGSQAQQIKQTATNFNAQCEIAVGATLVDPRSIRALTAADVVTVTPPTLTKGTQAATGFSVQNLVDAGRVNICATALDQALTAATETMVTMSVSRDGAAVSTATSNVITSGKRFRVTSITAFAEQGGSTPVVARVSVRLRFAATGGALTSSPLQVILKLPLLAATAKTIVSQFEDFPDGIEFLGDGVKAWGMSVLCPEWVTTTVLPTVSITLFGFEY